jgi:hypothetical protein
VAFQFLLRNRTSGEAIEVEDASARSLDFQLNGVHSAGVTVPLSGGSAAFVIPGSTRLEVWRTVEGFANQMVFWGEVPASAVKMDAAADTMELVFKDPRWRWEHMYTTTFYAGVPWPVADFIWQILVEWADINYMGPGWGVGQGVTDSGATTVTDQLTVEKISDRIGSLTRQVDGPDVDVSFGSGAPLIDVWNGMGSVKPDAVFRYGFSADGATLDSNVRGLLVSYTDPFNNIQTSWTNHEGRNPSTGWEQNEAAAQIYGTLQKHVTVSETITDDQGAFIHAGAQAALILPRMIIEIKGLTYDAPTPFDDFYLGDTVYVTAGKGALRIDGAGLRVHGIHLDIDQEGNPQTDITVAEV